MSNIFCIAFKNIKRYPLMTIRIFIAFFCCLLLVFISSTAILTIKNAINTALDSNKNNTKIVLINRVSYEQCEAERNTIINLPHVSGCEYALWGSFISVNEVKGYKVDDTYIYSNFSCDINFSNDYTANYDEGGVNIAFLSNLGFRDYENAVGKKITMYESAFINKSFSFFISNIIYDNATAANIYLNYSAAENVSKLSEIFTSIYVYANSYENKTTLMTTLHENFPAYTIKNGSTDTEEYITTLIKQRDLLLIVSLLVISITFAAFILSLILLETRNFEQRKGFYGLMIFYNKRYVIKAFLAENILIFVFSYSLVQLLAAALKYSITKIMTIILETEVKYSFVYCLMQNLTTLIIGLIMLLVLLLSMNYLINKKSSLDYIKEGRQND